MFANGFAAESRRPMPAWDLPESGGRRRSASLHSARAALSLAVAVEFVGEPA